MKHQLTFKRLDKKNITSAELKKALSPKHPDSAYSLLTKKYLKYNPLLTDTSSLPQDESPLKTKSRILKKNTNLHSPVKEIKSTYMKSSLKTNLTAKQAKHANNTSQSKLRKNQTHQNKEKQFTQLQQKTISQIPQTSSGIKFGRLDHQSIQSARAIPSATNYTHYHNNRQHPNNVPAFNALAQVNQIKKIYIYKRNLDSASPTLPSQPFNTANQNKDKPPLRVSNVNLPVSPQGVNVNKNRIVPSTQSPLPKKTILTMRTTSAPFVSKRSHKQNSLSSFHLNTNTNAFYKNTQKRENQFAKDTSKKEISEKVKGKRVMSTGAIITPHQFKNIRLSYDNEMHTTTQDEDYNYNFNVNNLMTKTEFNFKDLLELNQDNDLNKKRYKTKFRMYNKLLQDEVRYEMERLSPPKRTASEEKVLKMAKTTQYYNMKMPILRANYDLEKRRDEKNEVINSARGLFSDNLKRRSEELGVPPLFTKRKSAQVSSDKFLQRGKASTSTLEFFHNTLNLSPSSKDTATINKLEDQLQENLDRDSSPFENTAELSARDSCLFLEMKKFLKPQALNFVIYPHYQIKELPALSKQINDLMVKATRQLGKKNYLDAYNIFRSLYQYNKSNVQLRNNYSVSLIGMNKPKKAYNEILHAIKLYPKCTILHYNKALLEVLAGKYKKAIASCGTLFSMMFKLKEHLLWGDTLQIRGMAYFHLKDFDMAANDFDISKKHKEKFKGKSYPSHITPKYYLTIDRPVNKPTEKIQRVSICTPERGSPVEQLSEARCSGSSSDNLHSHCSSLTPSPKASTSKEIKFSAPFQFMNFCSTMPDPLHNTKTKEEKTDNVGNVSGRCQKTVHKDHTPLTELKAGSSTLSPTSSHISLLFTDKTPSFTQIHQKQYHQNKSVKRFIQTLQPRPFSSAAKTSKNKQPPAPPYSQRNLFRNSSRRNTSQSPNQQERFIQGKDKDNSDAAGSRIKKVSECSFNQNNESSASHKKLRIGGRKASEGSQFANNKNLEDGDQIMMDGIIANMKVFQKQLEDTQQKREIILDSLKQSLKGSLLQSEVEESFVDSEADYSNSSFLNRSQQMQQKSKYKFTRSSTVNPTISRKAFKSPSHTVRGSSFLDGGNSLRKKVTFSLFQKSIAASGDLNPEKEKLSEHNSHSQKKESSSSRKKSPIPFRKSHKKHKKLQSTTSLTSFGPQIDLKFLGIRNVKLTKKELDEIEAKEKFAIETMGEEDYRRFGSPNALLYQAQFLNRKGSEYNEKNMDEFYDKLISTYANAPTVQQNVKGKEEPLFTYEKYTSVGKNIQKVKEELENDKFAEFFKRKFEVNSFDLTEEGEPICNYKMLKKKLTQIKHLSTKRFAQKGSHLSFNEILALRDQFTKCQTRNIDLIERTIRKLYFFSKFPKFVRRRMAECGSYGFYPSNSPIFHQGDLGDSLYVILKGSVKMRVTNEEFGNTPVVLSTIFDGDHFGQILSMFKQNAKWYKKPRRKLSCIACEDTEVFNIPREAALFIVTNEITDALNKKVLFLKKFPFFRGFGESVLIPLAANLQSRYFKFGEYLVKAGEIPKGLIVIVNGRCTVCSEETHVVQDVKSLDPKFVNVVQEMYDEECTNIQEVRKKYHEIQTKKSPKTLQLKKKFPFFELSTKCWIGSRVLLTNESLRLPHIKHSKSKNPNQFKQESLLSVIANTSTVEVYIIGNEEMGFIPSEIQTRLSLRIVEGYDPDRPANEIDLTKIIENIKTWDIFKGELAKSILQTRDTLKTIHK